MSENAVFRLFKDLYLKSLINKST